MLIDIARSFLVVDQAVPIASDPSPKRDAGWGFAAVAGVADDARPQA
jgi:hypothetical protein